MGLEQQLCLGSTGQTPGVGGVGQVGEKEKDDGDAD